MAVVGAGLLGLAVARELARRRPALRIVVLEREDRIAPHQSSHNSGVLHAGLYYPPGSLKARLCRSGHDAMWELCERHDLPRERCGKVVVATRAAERAHLDELERRGRANGVPGLRRLTPAQLADLEPHARGVAALHSPSTAIVDFAAGARALAAEARASGVAVVLGAGVTGLERRARGTVLTHGAGHTEAGLVIGCAGAWSDRLARLSGGEADPRIVPFRGAYLRLRPERRHLVRALVYPVPDPRLPFLGAHFTRSVAGEVLVGPTALLAGARDAYALARVRGRDALDTVTWPGTWRLARRMPGAAATELRHALAPGALATTAARLVPALRRADLQFAFAGVRAQALGRDGHLVDDFRFEASDGALHVRNAPSPGATSALAIAAVIADRAEPAL